MEDFVVSARKYRPTRFADVVGQAHISQTLKNALRTDHVAHAFLFCGPRGVGKTTNARILAKLLNCTQRTADYEACNVCDSCRAFNENASFNIFELDAASNNGVEHIKTLIDQVRFAPQQGRYKVFIIDEVHMLTQAAFNAFLKTLEEPPAHAIFILATTEKHKIIPTILSRCQIFDFRRIQIPDIVLQLEMICKAEGIAAENDALHIIAQKADGAMRDALSIFDRIVSGTEKTLTYQDVIDNLNVLDYDFFFKMTEALLAENRTALFTIFDDVLRRGFEAELFINGLSEHFRNLLVCKDPGTLALLEVGDSLRTLYQQQASLAPVGFILTAMNITNECDIQFKSVRNKRIHAELALTKVAYISRATEIGGQGSAVVEKKTSEVRKEAKTAPAGVSKAGDASGAAGSAPYSGVQHQPLSRVEEEMTPGPSVVGSIRKTEILSATPKIGSLNDIAAMIEEEENLLAKAVSRLDYKNLTESWGKYSETVESPSLKLALMNASLTLEKTKVIAKTGSELAVSMMQGELNLITFLRFDLSAPDLTLQIWYDETLAPEESKATVVKKYLSPREKLQLMMEVNPLIKDFAIKFGLKPEE